MKKFILVLSIFCSCLGVFAQTYTPPAYAEINTDFRTQMNQVFGALEVNRVSTGLLVDYAFDFADPKMYNGATLTNATLTNQDVYSNVYKTMFTARVNSNISMTHPSIHDSLCYIARQKEVITLSGLLFKYNAIDDDVATNGKLQTVNGQLKDVYVNGVWQNPYDELTTCIVSPSISEYTRTHCSIVFVIP